MKSEAQAVAQELTEALADAGKIIEGGWDVFRITVILKEAPQIQVRGMWMAFFAGARHLFASIMDGMDSDREPTPSDLRRMGLIHTELESFRNDFELNHLPTNGRA
jgi:hypothetical protein